MNAAPAIAAGSSRWMDGVASTVATLLERCSTPRTVRLVQDKDDEFLVHLDGTTSASLTAERIRIGEDQLAGDVPTGAAAAIADSRVELVLKPDQFLFRPLELPSRATEFLNGIVRAQIDRLTPWDAPTAAFGWSRPVELSPDRMIVTIAATSLSFVRPFLDLVTKLGAHSVVVLTAPPSADPAEPLIKVWDQRARGALEIARIRKVLVMILTACGIVAAATVATAAIVEASLETYQEEVAQRLARFRTATGRDTDDSLPSLKRALERRKYESPSAVMVLDALSEILPDHTYVTELRIEANKVRLIGVTRDAASLIELIEKSGRFTRASFFGPTTRSSSEAGERFNIEAIIQPIASVRS